MKTRICSWCGVEMGVKSGEGITNGICKPCAKLHFGFQPRIKPAIKDNQSMAKTAKKLLGPVVEEFAGSIELRLAKVAPQEFYGNN